ncbi:MAG: InlB B-repeat-containing protein [Clostridia bacterium]|nr:InlB B-repeat-containing protein [Clostridia bacterium]
MMKQRRLSLKLIALLLAVATLLSVFPLSILSIDTAESPEPGSEELANVVILHNGAQKSSVTLAEYGKETLTALVSGVEFTTRTWQIRTPDGDQWISIYGKNGETLDVTLALVSSMLDANGCAYLRHVVKNGTKTYASAPIEIVISYKALTEQTVSPIAYNAAPAAQADEDGEAAPLISIVINYIFDNGGLAFEPYGASVAKGSSFNVTVTSPSVMGYDPFRRIDVIDEETGAVVGSDYISAKTVTIDIESIEENLTIYVIYEPAIVKFSVHHHLQDLTDDAYSMQADYVTTGYGLTGALVPENLEMDIPGFKSLAYDTTITIAADGSTVVEIRYDRIYYLVTFDMMGGYGTDPVYTRYGSEIGANPPTRHGYVFEGWELVSYGKEVPTDAQKSAYDINGNGKTITLPDASLTYRAKWITQLTTYTMVFWKENIDDNGFTYWGHLKNLTAMSGTVVDGEDRVDEVADIDDEKYFTYCDVLTDKDVIVEGDGSTVVNVYYTRNRYSITFKAPGKCVIPENHTHTREECYVTLCGESHTHTDACDPKLQCTLPVHEAHTDACIGCGNVEHTHTDACYCGTAEHTHTKECWPNAGNSANKPARAPNNPKDGQIYRSGTGLYAIYYIHIKGTWYRYNGTGVSNNAVVDPACSYKTEHTHESSCIRCEFTSEHVHSNACYKDTLHTHVEACYRYACEKEAHVHSDACYLLHCGIPAGHDHTSNCTNASKTNTVKIVYKKYQENISDIWPIVDGNGVRYDGGERWEPQDSSLYSAVLVFMANMPPENLTLALSESSASTYTMNYYLEVLPGQAYTHSYDGRNYVLYTTVKANYNYITKAEDFFDINGYTQLTSNPKFASNGQIKISTSNKTVNFYYGRKVDHKLEFSSNGTVLADKTVAGILYKMPLQDYYFEPQYPSNLEEGAYVFGGWYTSPGCFDGTEVDWSTLTMPAGGILLYANWVPIVHAVEIYTSYTNGEYKDKIGDTQYINHNYFANSPEKNPTNGSYVFQGWFYIDDMDGKEKAFVFTGIPVDQDMKIYAKWSSRITVSYKINYVLKIGGKEIAQSEIGQAIAGDNKTFYAKVDQALYEGYQTGFYPLTSSHTVTMSAEQPMHEYTFEYVYVESMPYAVKYVDENGNPIPGLETKREMKNTLSVVTETFVKISKMMPDAYQKRLILSATGEDLDKDGVLDNNVITFRYVADEQHAYYKVVHYIQNIAGDGYREYRSEEAKGVIKNSYTFAPITITGFAFNASKALLNGNPVEVNADGHVVATLGEDGLLVELYYDRVNVSYTVNYLESGTDKVLYTQKIGSGIFGGQVAERAPGLTHLGYTLVGEELKQLHLSSNIEINVINFYYEESIYSIKYLIVGSEGGGLSIGSENVHAVSGKANGSTPHVNKGYKFMGWFLDEACSRPVPDAWVNAETHQLIPQSNGVWTANATYYARIIPDVSTLTIHTAGAAEIDEGQVFIYRIQGVSANVADIDLTVTVTGNGSITVSDLEIGDYTVTCLTDWSFRYEVASESKKVSLAVDGNKNVVSFGQVRSLRQWLDGNHSIKNIFN